MIIATVKPKHIGSELLERLFSLGIRDFRINFSRGSATDNLELMRRIAQFQSSTIFVDLPGNKQRLRCPESIMLKIGNCLGIPLNPKPPSPKYCWTWHKSCDIYFD